MKCVIDASSFHASIGSSKRISNPSFRTTTIRYIVPVICVKPFSYHARDTKSSGEKIRRRATSKCRIAFKKRATTFHNSRERRIKISKIARGSAPDNSRPLSPSHEFKREILFEYLSHLPMFACVSADSNKDRYRDGLYTSPRFLSFLKCFIIIS